MGGLTCVFMFCSALPGRGVGTVRRYGPLFVGVGAGQVAAVAAALESMTWMGR